MRTDRSFRLTLPTAILCGATAAALIAAAPLVLAAPSSAPQTTANHQSSTATEQSNEQNSSRSQSDTQARIEALQDAKVTLTKAIDTAQSEHGKAFSARFELRRGKPYYLIRTFNGNMEWAGLIGADTGQVLGKGRMYPAGKLDPEDMHAVHALESAPTSLVEAVLDGERHEQGAKVLQARLVTTKTGASHYDLDIVQNGHTRVAMVNAQNGHLE